MARMKLKLKARVGEGVAPGAKRFYIEIPLESLAAAQDLGLNGAELGRSDRSLDYAAADLDVRLRHHKAGFRVVWVHRTSLGGAEGVPWLTSKEEG